MDRDEILKKLPEIFPNIDRWDDIKPILQEVNEDDWNIIRDAFELVSSGTVEGYDFKPDLLKEVNKVHWKYRELPENWKPYNSFPKWWPKSASTKIRWKGEYKKLKPFLDKNMTYKEIERQTGIPRQRVSHIIEWINRDIEAHR
jgi:hypothetical protein